MLYKLWAYIVENLQVAAGRQKWYLFVDELIILKRLTQRVQRESFWVSAAMMFLISSF